MFVMVVFCSLNVFSPIQYTKFIIIVFRMILKPIITNAIDWPITLEYNMSVKYILQIYSSKIISSEVELLN